MSTKKPHHGTSKARGCSHLNLGSFCRMFDEPSWSEDIGISEQCKVEEIMAALGGPNGLMHDADNSSADSELPAAYTFFAQFVDHDITLDTESKLHKGPDAEENKVAKATELCSHAHEKTLGNLRSASLDLDCVYGFGPEASPYLYDSRQPGRLLVGNKNNPNDLARNDDDTALIGDPRNDENIYVSQLQLMFIRFHNKRLIGRTFEEARKDCQYHYQWIVWHDFLKRICDKSIYDYVQDELKNSEFPKCGITDHCGRICMPIEFSVAAYRFGHTTVRSVYPVNEQHPVVELFDEDFGTLGFSHVPQNLTIDWTYLLDIQKCSDDFAKAKAFDHLLPDELIRMPDPIVGKFAPDNDRSLAFRNLLRGFALGLPSGQRVKAALCAKGYHIDKEPDLTKVPGWNCLNETLQTQLQEHTPLFFYLMVEAGQLGKGKNLGPVASAILLEVFGNMLLAEGCESILKDPKWRPDKCISYDKYKDKDKNLTLADIARYVSS